MKAVVDACGRFVRAIKDKCLPSWLSLLGTTGTGKTHCCDRIWNWAWPRFDWQRCEFIHRPIYWPAYVADMRSGIGFEQMRDMQQWPILFLDDIGAERDTTGFASEQLNMLLGCRVGKWTMLTSNMTLKQLAGIDPRIADRVIREFGNRWVEIHGKSYALRSHENQTRQAPQPSH